MSYQEYIKAAKQIAKSALEEAASPYEAVGYLAMEVASLRKEVCSLEKNAGDFWAAEKHGGYGFVADCAKCNQSYGEKQY